MDRLGAEDQHRPNVHSGQTSSSHVPPLTQGCGVLEVDVEDSSALSQAIMQALSDRKLATGIGNMDRRALYFDNRIAHNISRPWRSRSVTPACGSVSGMAQCSAAQSCVGVRSHSASQAQTSEKPAVREDTMLPPRSVEDDAATAPQISSRLSPKHESCTGRGRGRGKPRKPKVLVPSAIEHDTGFANEPLSRDSRIHDCLVSHCGGRGRGRRSSKNQRARSRPRHVQAPHESADFKSLRSA